MSFTDFASLTSSMYLDVNIGISDDSVFKLPDDCPTTHDTRGENSVLPQVSSHQLVLHGEFPHISTHMK